MASVPPSGFTLTGLVQHMAEVERNWFRRVRAPPCATPWHLARGDRPRPRALGRPCPGRHWPLHGAGRQPPLDLAVVKDLRTEAGGLDEQAKTSLGAALGAADEAYRNRGAGDAGHAA